MGAIISQSNLTDFNRDLISILKQKKFAEIAEILDNIRTLFPMNNTLNYEEFNEVFIDFFPDNEEFFKLLQNSHSLTGVIDVYECVASIVMFSGEEFEEKCRFIFFLFDFNNSQTIEMKELVLSFQSTIRGLCKLVQLPVPSLEDVEEIANKLFEAIDYNKSKTIEFEEFKSWILNSYELQDFLLKYTGTQTFENAKRRFNYFYIKYKAIFNKVSGDVDAQDCDLDSLITVIKKDMNEIDENSIEALSKTLIDTSKEENSIVEAGLRIKKEAYCIIMKAWAAFTATDINNDGKLDKNELKFLIYAYDDTIADIFRIEHELKIMDKDNSGQINREEWLNFLSTDPDNSGKRIFRSNLRMLFSKFDKDNSGMLSKSEIFELLKENFRLYKTMAMQKGDETLENFEGMIESLAQEIIQDLESDEQGGLSWGEFKNYMEKCSEKETKLRKFLDNILS